MRRFGILFAVVCWVLVLAAGVTLLAAHQYTPGATGPVLSEWQEGDPLARPKLVLFAHPQCPCTPTSVRNFAAIVAETGCDALVYVAAADPADTTNGRAALAAGLEVLPDADGAVARRFGARTSGHVFAYAAGGRLTFHGGITAGRGHAGDNPGVRAARSALTPSAQPVSLPVFGCPLRDPDE